METQLKLLEQIFGRADALNGYWNLYIAVALGLLGVMGSGKPFTELQSIKILLSVAFVVFALSNLDAIDSTNEQRRQLLLLLKDGPYFMAAKAAGPPEPWQLRTFHLALDLIIVLSVWLVPWHKVGRAASEG